MDQNMLMQILTQLGMGGDGGSASQILKTLFGMPGGTPGPDQQTGNFGMPGGTPGPDQIPSPLPTPTPNPVVPPPISPPAAPQGIIGEPMPTVSSPYLGPARSAAPSVIAPPITPPTPAPQPAPAPTPAPAPGIAPIGGNPWGEAPPPRPFPGTQKTFFGMPGGKPGPDRQTGVWGNSSMGATRRVGF